MKQTPMPPIPPGYDMPFYYSTLAVTWLYYPADPGSVRELLEERGPGLETALFDRDGHAVVVLVFMKYASQFDDGVSVTLESELNLITYPRARRGAVPRLTLAEYLRGEDQTKTLGQLRLFVPADNPVAVCAGRALFGEPKFLANFQASIPALNSPSVTTWTFSPYDPDEDVDCDDGAKVVPRWGARLVPHAVDAFDPARRMFTASVDLTGRAAEVANQSSLIRYAQKDGRPTGSRWNLLGTWQTFDPGEAGPPRVTLDYGPSNYQGMREAMESIIGATPASAVQTYASPPAAIEARAFYADV